MTFEAQEITSARRTPIVSGWFVESVGGPVPPELAGKRVAAEVPGSVHTDLLAAGLIVDPYLDDHERLVAWIGACDWRYSTSFVWSAGAHERSELVFHGLDTIAHIELNGTALGETANMHRTYRFDVRELLVDGDNELVVTFSSPIAYADRASLELGYRPHVNHHPYNAIRKMACSFGWDWGLDTATSGMWRPVELHEWSRARVASVRPTATVDGPHGLLTVRAEIAGEAEGLALRVSAGGASVEVKVISPSVEAKLTLDDVVLWWPVGHGPQNLYDLTVEVVAGGAVIDTVEKRVGFRTVSLDTSSDSTGSGMTFVVNGRPLFIRGANWIPDDAFPHRVTRERYACRLEQGLSANVNLMRVWGGGIFESDDFYDLCDELGIMVWQDFLFACAAYAEEEPMWSEIDAEARDNVTRLMPHPSLIIWNGSNENLEGYHDWGWQSRLQGRTWGDNYYFDLLPSIVAELDPGRLYTPSSPWSPDGTSGPNDPAHGSIHIWDMWNREDYLGYREKNARFVAEFGWQGPPTWSTMRSSVSDVPLTPESPGMIVHQKAVGGNDKLTDGLVAHLPYADDIDDWHWSMALTQATAVRTGIEHFRSLSPHCGGTIVWQLNDCWPVTSWAAVDGYGRAKPLLYAIRHAYRDRLVTIQPRAGGLSVVVVNDSADAFEGELLVTRLSYDGSVLHEERVNLRVPARETRESPIAQHIASPADSSRELIVATLGGERGLWFFADYKESGLDAGGLSTRAIRVEGGYRVECTATTVVRDLALLVDKVDPEAVVDTMLVDLLPGESVSFSIASDLERDPSVFLAPSVLKTANGLLHTIPTT
jgi:beta-mannosidase